MTHMFDTGLAMWNVDDEFDFAPPSKRQRVAWTQQEDEAILAAASQFGTQWGRIAGVLPGRSADAVRNRCHKLQSMLPGAVAGCGRHGGSRRSEDDEGKFSRIRWTPEEDQLIDESVRRLGFRWRQIAAMLPGRSDSSVRNRWTRHQQQRMHEDDTGRIDLDPPLARARVDRGVVDAFDDHVDPPSSPELSRLSSGPSVASYETDFSGSLYGAPSAAYFGADAPLQHPASPVQPCAMLEASSGAAGPRCGQYWLSPPASEQARPRHPAPQSEPAPCVAVQRRSRPKHSASASSRSSGPWLPPTGRVLPAPSAAPASVLDLANCSADTLETVAPLYDFEPYGIPSGTAKAKSVTRSPSLSNTSWTGLHEMPSPMMMPCMSEVDRPRGESLLTT